MEESKLSQTLVQKYNIKEPIYVEGRFVALLGNTKNAVCLVKLGIGKRCFIVTLVNLAGDDEEYDLISMSPLSLLTFHCHNKSKRLKVCCAFKSTKVYQLCTSDDQDEIWKRFKHHISQLSMDRADNGWVDQQLEYPGYSTATKATSTRQLQIAEVDEAYYAIMEELYPYQAKLSRRFNGSLRIKGENRKFSRSGSVLTIMPSTLITDQAYKPLNRSQSESNLDKIRFDSFVNEVTTRHKSGSSKLVACRLGKSTNDLFRLETVSLDKSNNNPMRDEEEEEYDEYADDEGGYGEEFDGGEQPGPSTEEYNTTDQPKKSICQKLVKLVCPCIKA